MSNLVKYLLESQVPGLPNWKSTPDETNGSFLYIIAKKMMYNCKESWAWFNNPFYSIGMQIAELGKIILKVICKLELWVNFQRE